MSDYHWTGTARRQFLEALAETGSVSLAANSVSKSRRAAYNLRFRAEGAAFRLAWDAAILIARAVVEDVLMERVLHGQRLERTRSEDGTLITTTRYDTRLSMALLARLDRMTGAEGDAAAQAVAGDFAAYLDLVEAGGTAQDAAAFVAERTAQDSQPQCELAENSANSETETPIGAEEASALSVWFCPYKDAWRTNFPPPPGFDGDEDLSFGEDEYSRALTLAEAEAQDAIALATAEPVWEAGEQARDLWFGFVGGLRSVCEEEAELEGA